jgi:hypothetical protein
MSRDKDERIQELLASNNQLLERARKAEAAYHLAVVKLGGSTPVKEHVKACVSRAAQTVRDHNDVEALWGRIRKLHNLICDYARKEETHIPVSLLRHLCEPLPPHTFEDAKPDKWTKDLRDGGWHWRDYMVGKDSWGQWHCWRDDHSTAFASEGSLKGAQTRCEDDQRQRVLSVP